jgi:hypothetical protein
MNFYIKQRIIHAPHLQPKEPVIKEPKMEVVQRVTLPEEPTALEMAQNFGGAMLRWARAGFRTASAETAAARAAICADCEFWAKDARFGLGKCRAKGCGCTSLKLWLATEKCPKGKWPAASGQNAEN